MAYYRNSDMVASRNRSQIQTGVAGTSYAGNGTGYSSMGVYGAQLRENFSVSGSDAGRPVDPPQYAQTAQIPLSTGYYATESGCDRNSLRYSGWDPNSLGYSILMSDVSVELVSNKCTELLAGVHPEGRPIIFPKASVVNVLDSVYQSHTPRVGDIYSRYTQPAAEQRNDVAEMQQRAIKIITDQVRNEYEIAEQNSRLDRRVTVLGDFNEHGLRQYSQISQINHRGPSRYQISDRY